MLDRIANVFLDQVELGEQAVGIGFDHSLKGPLRILASGGTEKIAALRGAMALIRPTVLITDEASASALLTD